MESDYPDTEHALACGVIKLNGDEPYCGQPIRSSRLIEKWHCIVLGIQKDGYPVIMPDAHMIIKKDDIIWVMILSRQLPEGVSYDFAAVKLCDNDF